jgi:uncharacterized Zn-binding protein involved in type VI secretion
MPNIARLSHSTSAGPAIVVTRAAQNSVYIDDFLVAVADPGGSTQITGHGLGHTNVKINQGSSTVFIEGKPVSFAGAALTCSHTIAGSISSSGTVD